MDKPNIGPVIHDILDLIKARRSITNYLSKPVEWEYISRMIDAARHAPSCGNLQNWKFIIVTELDKRKAIAEAALQQYWMASAPVHIVVCAEPEKAERYYGIRGDRLYTVQNCAAAIENMLLEAQSVGLGTCWIGAFDEEMVKRTLRAEEFVRPQAIVTVGYPASIPSKPPKLALNEITYFERWRGRVRDPAVYFRDYAVVIQRELAKGKEMIKDVGSKVIEKVKGVIAQAREKREDTQESDEEDEHEESKKQE